jgi:hypothetical protein
VSLNPSNAGFGHCIVVRIRLISVADPHHFDADLDADLHLPYHFDEDPDAYPDPIADSDF